MKRLTRVYDCETPKRIAVTKGKYPQTWSETTAVGKALLRLAAYEDTGLEPKTLNEFAPFLLEMKMNIGAMRHLKELLQAEKDGRLVVLPCKVGDILFAAEDSPVIPVAVADIGIVLDGPGGEDWESLSNIGKTVFLTREEAEAVLKKEGGRP